MGVTLAIATGEAQRPRMSAVASRPSASELFERYVTFVWRVVAAHGVRDADVADVTQDVFVVAFKKLESWQPQESAITTWLYGIATRVAMNHRRKAHVRREAPADFSLDERVSPEAAERGVLLSELADALLGLDEAQRDVFVLFEIAELTMHEVAVTVGCPLKTAYKRLYSARRAIAKRLDGEDKP